MIRRAGLSCTYSSASPCLLLLNFFFSPPLSFSCVLSLCYRKISLRIPFPRKGSVQVSSGLRFRFSLALDFSFTNLQTRLYRLPTKLLLVVWAIPPKQHALLVKPTAPSQRPLKFPFPSHLTEPMSHCVFFHFYSALTKDLRSGCLISSS